MAARRRRSVAARSLSRGRDHYHTARSSPCHCLVLTRASSKRLQPPSTAVVIPEQRFLLHLFLMHPPSMRAVSSTPRAHSVVPRLLGASIWSNCNRNFSSGLQLTVVTDAQTQTSKGAGAASWTADKLRLAEGLPHSTAIPIFSFCGAGVGCLTPL